MNRVTVHVTPVRGDSTEYRNNICVRELLARVHLTYAMAGIELADLKNKPFYDLDEKKLSVSGRRTIWLYMFLECVTSLVIYFNYGRLLLLYPLLAPTLLGASTAALAQSINQYIKGRLVDSRVVKFAIWGLINGCFSALWIEMLILNLDSVIYRVLLDQAVGAPLFQLLFNILSSVWDQDGQNTRATFFRALRYSYCYWPFVSIAMFVFVPPQFMFVCNCFANLLWNLILSRVT